MLNSYRQTKKTAYCIALCKTGFSWPGLHPSLVSPKPSNQSLPMRNSDVHSVLQILSGSSAPRTQGSSATKPKHIITSLKIFFCEVRWISLTQHKVTISSDKGGTISGVCLIKTLGDNSLQALCAKILLPPAMLYHHLNHSGAIQWFRSAWLSRPVMKGRFSWLKGSWISKPNFPQWISSLRLGLGVFLGYPKNSDRVFQNFWNSDFQKMLIEICFEKLIPNISGTRKFRFGFVRNTRLKTSKKNMRR